MSKIALSPDGEAAYEKMPVSGCRVEITHSDWKSLVRENEKKPFSIRTGELMRVFLRPLQDRTTVAVIAHHLAGDGKSIAYFIERALEIYAGKAAQYRPLHLITDHTFPEKSRLTRWMRWWVSAYNRRFTKSGRIFDWNDYDELHKTYWRGRQSVILTGVISRGQTEKIHAKAREAGVSVNSFLVTSFLRVDPALHAVGMAVDARMDGNRTMSNQASGITVDYTYDGRLSFEANARNVHKRIYRKLNSPVSRYFILRFMPLFTPSLLDSLSMLTYGLYENPVSKKLADVMGYTAAHSTSFGVTNLTRLDIAETYRDCRIENLYFIPPVVSYSRQTIGIATMENGMTMTSHCVSDTFDEKMRKRFDDAVKLLSSV